MRLKKLTFLSDYKKFKKGDCINFNKNRLIALVGQNGSGKTTILSMLSQLFFHLERYSKKIDFDIKLEYSINVDNTLQHISLRHSKNTLEISVNNSDFIGIVPMKEGDKVDTSWQKNHQNLKELHTISQIKKYLPSKVIGSTFSTQKEYPEGRPYNYRGELKGIYTNISIDLFINSDTQFLTGLSKNILTVAQNYEVFYEVFDLQWTGKLKIYRKENSPSFIGNLDGPIGDWEQVVLSDIEVFQKHEDLDKNLYINDIEFRKSDETIVTLNQMSAGEKSVFTRILGILHHATQNCLILIEEPELFLNPVWQIKYLKFVANIFQEDTQILFTTHSPYILSGASATDCEIAPLHTNQKLEKLLSKEPKVKLLLEKDEHFKTNTDIISYRSFNLITISLHITLFTFLENKHGGLSRLSKFFVQKNITSKKHSASVSYGKVKEGDEIVETLPLYIRNATHHSDEKNRIYSKSELEESILIMLKMSIL